MLGWYEIAFKEAKTGRRRVFNLDELAGSVSGATAAEHNPARKPVKI
jgi:hypothetical protein